MTHIYVLSIGVGKSYFLSANRNSNSCTSICE